MELRPYQQAALKASAEAEARGVTRQLFVMATGVGKTLVVAGLLKAKGLPNTFGFMHRDELLGQSREKILALNPEARIGIEKADLRSDPSNDQVILASVQTVGRRDRKRLSRIPADWPKVVWIDESHHAPARSYLETLDYFGVYGETPRRDRLVVGTTATPERLDQLGYDKIFDDVVFRYNLRDGIKDKWLADIHAWRITTGLDLGGVRVSHGDFVERELAEAVEASDMDAAAAQTWTEHCRGRKSLFYCVTKKHGEHMLERLRAAGAKAELVVDSTPKGDRARLVEGFKNGDLEAVINVQVLTEGFDAPSAECLHILRPTKSATLYTQILGRGSRRTETKTFVEVFDYTAQDHDVCSIGRIFGLPDAWDLYGQDILEDKEKLEEAEEVGVKTEGARSLAELFAQLDRRRLEFVKSSITDSGMPSRFAWLRPSREEDRWVLAWSNKKPGDERWLNPHAKQIHDEHKLWGTRERLEIFRNELGLYEGWIYQMRGDGGKTSTRVGTSKSLVKFVAELEGRIEDVRPHTVNLLDKKAKWGFQPSTEKQQNILREKGVPDWFLPQLNKREASMLITMPWGTVRKMFENVSKPA
jgi:superfamily II DNA or RNA helicase